MLKALALVAALSTTAPAEPYLRFDSPREACTPLHVDCVALTPGYFLDEQTFGKLDHEIRRLQDAETRLSAENKSLKASASEGPGVLMLLAVSAVAGLVLGVYLGSKF